MKKIFLISLLTFSALNANNYADAITVSVGKILEGGEVYRVGLRKDFDSKVNRNKVGYYSGYYELTLNYWHGKRTNNYGIAFSPVFAYYFDYGDIKPYVELGIGVSYWRKNYLDNRHIGSRYHFEDRIGVGVRYKKYDFSIRRMHYSNAGLKHPNSGMDMIVGSIAYKF